MQLVRRHKSLCHSRQAGDHSAQGPAACSASASGAELGNVSQSAMLRFAEHELVVTMYTKEKDS